MNRKTLVLLALSPLLATACSQPQPPAATPAAVAPAAAAPALETPPPLAPDAAVPAPPDDSAAADAPSKFACKSGKTVEATYPTTETATVVYDGKTIAMKIAVSGSGARYTGDGLEWWTKGNEGTMSKLLPDGTSGDIIENCTTG